MAGDSAMSYVQRFGRQLLGGQAAALPQAPALPQGGVMDERGALGGGMQAPGPQPSGAFTAPVEGPGAVAAPALEQQDVMPGKAATGNPADFWSLAEKTPAKEQEKIADALDQQFKAKGSSLKEQFDTKVADGTIKTPTIGKKFDRKQMGLFLFEAGLRTLQRAGKGEDAASAVSGGVLDTLDAGAKKKTATQERDDRLGESEKDRQLRRTENDADRKARAGEGAADRDSRLKEGEADRRARREEMDADRILRRDLAKQENLSRERQVKMQAGKDKDTIIGADGKVYWKPDTPGQAGKPVLVEDKDGKPVPLVAAVKPESGAVTEELVLKESNNIRAGLDKSPASMVMINGTRTPWSKLDEKAKAAYMKTIKASMRQKDPASAENEAPAWAR